MREIGHHHDGRGRLCAPLDIGLYHYLLLLDRLDGRMPVDEPASRLVDAALDCDTQFDGIWS